VTLRLAHRGDWRSAPENSLGALVAAMAVPGCDGVELDVRLSRDGVPVLLHDLSLARVQGVPVDVDQLTAAELAGHGIPDLESVVQALPSDAFLDVELKGEGHGEATAAVLRATRGDEPHRAVLSSFDAATLASMVDRLPGWAHWLNTEDMAPATLSLAIGLGCRAVSVQWGAITHAAVDEAHAVGLEVAGWTVLRPAAFERLRRLGLVAVCVDGAALEGAAPDD
jgi:glycerophosphoryl diester phosphodiesterase